MLRLRLCYYYVTTINWFSRPFPVLAVLFTSRGPKWGSSEVNRLCLAAEKPLLEAGSTGHLGQARLQQMKVGSLLKDGDGMEKKYLFFCHQG